MSALSANFAVATTHNDVQDLQRRCRLRYVDDVESSRPDGQGLKEAVENALQGRVQSDKIGAGRERG